MTYVTRPDEDAVLATINDLRAELELPPLDAIPRGMPRSSRKCPVAQALESDDGSWATVLSTDWMVCCGSEVKKHEAMPPILMAFTRAFDHGEYPDLIEGRAP